MNAHLLFPMLLYALAGPRLPEPVMFDPTPPRPVLAILDTYDGDTTRVILGLDAETSRIESIRVDGYNAPELRRANPDSYRARDDLIAILGLGDVWIDPTGKRSAGRLVGAVYVVRDDGFVIDVAAAMRSRGWNGPWGW